MKIKLEGGNCERVHSGFPSKQELMLIMSAFFRAMRVSKKVAGHHVGSFLSCRYRHFSVGTVCHVEVLRKVTGLQQRQKSTWHQSSGQSLVTTVGSDFIKSFLQP
ncbi:hypothetical protein NE237_010243 [Protea cynaroides]|uniref:Uncharacterized protein n=1 Tax=Protea cynaroides TaxID=273540 RepID=A0A9Q0KYY5_9MAGN|nr:hypothetical protein NE237_010243 [Protea cynaroides]